MLTIILISLKYFESIVIVILFNFKTDLKIYVEITRCPLQTYMYLVDKKVSLRYELNETKFV